MTDRSVRVAVVGGGQAGLATSWHLTRAEVDHVVFEAQTIAHEWADTRWDNFTLVTPNWHCELPGYSYSGDDPDGFMTRDQVAEWLAGYAPTFGPPVREHARVTALTERDGGGFVLIVAGQDGEEIWESDSVVIATGGYHAPVVPPWAAAIDPAVTQLEPARYKNAARLPEGAVLVVGSGQSGAQIAEDLHLAGRQVHLAIGSAPRVARFYRGKDVMTWLAEMGLYDTPVQQYPGGLAAREKTNHYVTGRDGGRDIDLRRFAAEGMRLYGVLDGGRGTRLTFRPTLTQSLDKADSVYNSICGDIDRYLEREGIDAPVGRHYEPVWFPESDPVDLDMAEAGITSIIWAIGYRPDYRWAKVGIFDGTGHPTHTRGVTAIPGLYFIGLPWLHTWGSGRFHGIARDAEHVVGCIVGPDPRAGMDIKTRTPLDGAAVADWIAGADWIASPVSAAPLGLPVMRIGAVAAHFGRDIGRALVKIEGIIADARAAQVELLVFPDATLGGYLFDLRHPDPLSIPPGLTEDSHEISRICALAGEMVVCFGYAEAVTTAGWDGLYNSALCVTGDGILGRHRKVHQPAGESLVYAAGDTFAAFDTPVGRLGLLIDYDKTFPEAARSLALGGATIVACLSAWPASMTDRASRLPQDRQSRLFDLYDSARAAENQVVLVSSNQTGVMGGLRFLGQAKVVGPGGDILARTSSKGGLAVAEIDVAAEVARSRRILHHLKELAPSAYTSPRTATAGNEPDS